MKCKHMKVLNPQLAEENFVILKTIHKSNHPQVIIRFFNLIMALLTYKKTSYVFTFEVKPERRSKDFKYD